MKDTTTLESLAYMPQQKEQTFRERLEELLQGPHDTPEDLGLAAYLAGCLYQYPDLGDEL